MDIVSSPMHLDPTGRGALGSTPNVDRPPSGPRPSVIEQCAPGFARAILEAEIDDDWAQLKLVCISTDDRAVEADVPAVALVEIHYSLDAIWQSMARQSGQRWETCTFTVHADGRFKLDVAY